MEALKKLGDSEEDDSRETLCQGVIDRYNVDARALIDELDECKVELNKVWNAKVWASSFPRARSKVATKMTQVLALLKIPYNSGTC